MGEVSFLYDGLWPVVRVVFMAVVGYLVLLLLVRVSGQRTLAQLSSLDFLIVVTLGSAFGRVITARDVALAEVFAAFASLIAMQWLVGVVWAHPKLRRLVGFTPTLLYHDGQVVRSGLRRSRLRETDLQHAVRSQGLGSLDEARAIVLEPNGSLTVLQASSFGDGSAVPAGAEDGRAGR